MGFAEQYFTLSHAGVLRGMHLQLPPHQHGKLVTCLSGRILDVLLDLRRASPTCGNSLGIELSPERGQALYLPAGIAHGFLSLEDNSGVLYGTTSVHDPHCDTGVRWDSFGFVWPVNEPLISARDAALPALAAFDSPF
jgi:dTDP-4-dehydrorhamnose 3,5-epimerase